MDARLFRLYALLLVAVTSAGCEVVEGIFKAGVWVGIVMVAVVIGLVLMLLSKLRT